MPFRSEQLQVRERIRRAEEDAATLLERQRELALQLRAKHGERAWWLVVCGVIGVSLIGYGLGDVAAARDAAHAQAERDAQEANELSYHRMRAIQCQGAAERTVTELSACRHGLAEHARAVESQTKAATPCACEPADSLCQCPFDRAAVATSFAAAQAPIQMCFVPRKALSFHSKLTFASRTGQVESAVIDSSDGNLTEVDKSCVLAVLARIKVPAFGGTSMSVGKSFTVRGP